ncbi:MAG TPA: ankyrin repeat domain-containing protein [Acidobacteria bacterium]|nr:ankyrin repeat domain-containing protein [Acidobacteriota bacterium]
MLPLIGIVIFSFLQSKGVKIQWDWSFTAYQKLFFYGGGNLLERTIRIAATMTAVMIAAGLGKRAAQEITHYQWDETKAIAALRVALDARVDINAANEHGETALHAAAYHNANDVIRFLVTAGARIDATNAARQTPLRIADGHLICCTTFARHDEATRVLRELGADPDAGVQLTFGLTAFGDADSPSR